MSSKTTAKRTINDIMHTCEQLYIRYTVEAHQVHWKPYRTYDPQPLGILHSLKSDLFHIFKNQFLNCLIKTYFSLTEHKDLEKTAGTLRRNRTTYEKLRTAKREAE